PRRGRLHHPVRSAAEGPCSEASGDEDQPAVIRIPAQAALKVRSPGANIHLHKKNIAGPSL
ncbi:MAG: hypothetical protein IKM63_05955, partial [Firmicutes bacterium]|nr:hypothetical protein [Bacillota bacterium]